MYMARAQGGLARLSQILTRMTEAARLEQSLADAERERFDVVKVVRGCVDGYRHRVSRRANSFSTRSTRRCRSTARPTCSRRCSTSWWRTRSSSAHRPPDRRARGGRERHGADLGDQRRPAAARRDAGAAVRLDGVGARRAQRDGATPHLGLGLYIVRLIAEFHGGSARADNRADGSGVVVTVSLPMA